VTTRKPAAGLFEPPPAKVGPNELAWRATVAALKAEGKATGLHTAAISAIRTAARAADGALYCHRVEPSGYTADVMARCARTFHDLLAAAGLSLPIGPGNDPFADFLASIAGDDQAAPRDRPPA
jgi:hypothetical protein